jgi:alcohol dehydrogenase class IV
VTPFALRLPRHVEIGPGVSAKAAEIAAALGRRALLVTGADPARHAWLEHALCRAGLAVETVATPGEPSVEDAERAVAAARAHGADVVAAVGGGSALDLGKAAAALAGQAGGPLDHLEVIGAGRPLAADPLPWIAVPTTAGTGAEATINAVLGSAAHRRKASLRDPRMLPAAALVDPDLLAGCPRGVALASGLDAIVQVIEPYLSRFANPVVDALCRDAIPRGLSALPRMLEGDAAARPDMALVSFTGGVALTNAKLGAVHGLAGVIGGRTGAPHGAICGRLLAPILRANAAAAPSVTQARIAEVRAWIARALGGAPEAAEETLEAWIDEAGLPRLAALGVSTSDHLAIAEAAALSSSMKGNPVDLDAEALAAALAAA